MMERLFQHSGWLKVLSVGLAILLWAMAYGKDSSKTFEVPLTVIYHPQWQLYEGPNQNQKVTIRADGKLFMINFLREHDFHATLDLRKVSDPGKATTLDVEVTGRKLTGVTYAALPSSFTVTLVETKERDVQPTLNKPEGQVSRNGDEWKYTARIKQDFATVRLSGRSDLVNAVSQALVALGDEDLTPPAAPGVVTVNKKLIALDASGKTISDKLPTPTIPVLIEWVKLPPGTKLKVAPITRGSVPTGYVVTSMVANPPEVSVRSATPDGKVPDVKTINTAAIDISGKRTTFSATVAVVPPPGTTADIATVNVTVNIGEVGVDRVFKGITLGLRGKAENTDVATAVTDVTLTLKGPYTLLNSLDPATLTAFVDVEGVREGKHTLPVKVTGVPAGVTVTADPAIVDVTITIK